MKRIAVLTAFAGCLAWSLTFAGQQQQREQEQTRRQKETQQQKDPQFEGQTGQLWKQIAQNHKRIVEMEVDALQGSNQPQRGAGQGSSDELQDERRPQQRQPESLRPEQTDQAQQDQERDTAFKSSRQRLWQQIAQVHRQIVALQLAHAKRQETGQGQERSPQAQQEGQSTQQQQQEPGQQTDRQFQQQMRGLILRLGMLHQQAIAFDMADTLQGQESLRPPRSGQRGQQEEQQPRQQ